jgi:transposase
MRQHLTVVMINRYYLCVPKPKRTTTANDTTRPPKIVSIDPGVVSFAVCFDPDGLVVEWGRNAVERIRRLFATHEELMAGSRRRKRRPGATDVRDEEETRRTVEQEKEKEKEEIGGPFFCWDMPEEEKSHEEEDDDWWRSSPLPKAPENPEEKKERRRQEKIARRHRWRNRHRAAHVRGRIRRLVDDVHRRLARWLCETYVQSLVRSSLYIGHVVV